jgi:hypothetical protein
MERNKISTATKVVEDVLTTATVMLVSDFHCGAKIRGCNKK